jgi:predicted AlkP superfamily pyrophosphatase or phosphodiesterase
MLTGLPPRDHGIVGNGWYNREMAEVQFWKQSNPLVQGEKVWETAKKRDASVTTANLFWWYNMYSSADYSVTPRPIYKADGRKLPDVYSEPADLREKLQSELGQFPLFNFWGPASSIKSSQWIGAAARLVQKWCHPTLALVYLPHLDYSLQKLGPSHPDIPRAVREVDEEIGKLINHFEAEGYRILILSEYGIEPVEDSVHVNKVLREEGWIRVREEQGLELLDPGASRAFAVADHQIAHVYLKDPKDERDLKGLLENVPGVDAALDRREQSEFGIDHERSGELVLIAGEKRWFSYDYWLEDEKAPDFARTVDIHRKPGYDPCELFIDPAFRFPKLSIAWKLLRKKLGMRNLMDVIPLDASLVKGSHGRTEQSSEFQPIVATREDLKRDSETIPCTEVKEIILDYLFGD